ncbi:MBL fold metallo-hydrolase [uncultured Cytophaga sp.]|uniref:MBL fold metallo-hydrolase n=1 Tax=uncultured Cytophaga sp. TaxID=160238 RepID=UPI002628F709|nr:MBL fold metallo-hydrolase [uncultured Cytophaga sp.]
MSLKRTYKIMLLTGIILAIFTSGTILFLQTAPFGNTPSNTRLKRIIKSPNYKDGAFQNTSPTPMMSDDASYMDMLKQQFVSDSTREPQKPIPNIKRDLTILPSDKPTITWFGHSTYLIQLNGKNILVDPVFSNSTSPVQGIGNKKYMGTEIYSPSDFPNIDVVILTHDHYDHLDYQTTLDMRAKVGGYYMPLGVGSHLESWEIDTAKIHELDWWDEINLASDIKLVCLPARHFSGRSITDRNKTLWASYLLITPTHKLYLGGDSGYDTHFKQINEKYGAIDIAFLESGQYNAYWPFIHMMPEETVQASVDLQAKVLMPVHWGKYTLAFHAWNEPINRLTLEAHKKKVTVVTPMIGETVILDSIFPNSRWWEK